MFGHLRSISSACQFFQGCIASVLKESAALPAAQRTAYLKVALNSIFGDVDKRIAAEFKAIEQLFCDDVLEFEWGSADVTSIELAWTQVKASFAAAVAATENQEQKFKEIGDNNLDGIIYTCMSLTLSPGINDVMGNLRVGQPLDVEFEFGKQFPQNPDLRKRLLLEMAQESSVIDGGVVDVDQGVIYKAAPTRAGQLASTWRLCLLLVAGFLVPLALALAGKVLPDWPFAAKDLPMLLANFVLIQLGSTAHLAVAALKAQKAPSRPSFQVLNDWVLWVHVREIQILKGILSIWGGFILLSFGIRSLTWSSAFFAGYSIDSVTELFLGRFESTAAAKIKLLAKTGE
jgi:hypothetical protein